MNLENRLRKLESINSFEPKIIFVRFGDDVKVLSCAGEKFYRDENESEDDFLSRIMGIIKLRPNRPDVTVLTSGF